MRTLESLSGLIRGDLLGHRTIKYALLVGVSAWVMLGIGEGTVFAAPTKTKTLSVFKGRALVTVPLTTQKLTKLYSNMYLGQPTDSTKKFALYISKDSLGSDETTLTTKQLASSIKIRLEGQGYTVLSLKTQGQAIIANFEGYTEVPWQKVGTAPVRGVARFVRTADKQLIGSLLVCDPPAWAATDVKGYKTAVLKTKVANR